MIKSRNKFRHKWVDDGKPEGTNLYTYTCAKCGKTKIKVDAFSAEYYDETGKSTNGIAPECVAVKDNEQKHKLLGKPYFFSITNKSSIGQKVSLFGSESIPKEITISTPYTSYKQWVKFLAIRPCIIGLIRIESSIPLGASVKRYINYTHPDSRFKIAHGRNFKDDTNVWEYFCDICLDKDSLMQFNIQPNSELKLILFPACKISEVTPLNKRKLSGWA